MAGLWGEAAQRGLERGRLHDGQLGFERFQQPPPPFAQTNSHFRQDLQDYSGLGKRLEVCFPHSPLPLLFPVFLSFLIS